MFTKDERSSFKYWFAHWCAFNMLALNQRCWKFHHLFHDIEKPWLKLFLPYEKVQKIHRNHNKHHVEYFLKHGTANWIDMALDWECSHYTKKDCQLHCNEYLYTYIKNHPELTTEQALTIRDELIWACYKIGI